MTISYDPNPRDTAGGGGGDLFGPDTLAMANGAGGDPSAVDELLRRVHRRMRRLARFAAGQDLDTADVVVQGGQRLFVGPAGARTGRWKSPAHFRNAYVQAMGWVLADHAKARRRRLRRANPHADARGRPPKPVAEVSDLDVAKLYGGDPSKAIDVLDGLAKLERAHPAWHAAVVGRHYGGLTFAQLGRDLNIAPETVRNWYHLGVAQLRNIFRALRPPGSSATDDDSTNS